MPRTQKRLESTDTDVLVANLRSEVIEVIQTFVMLGEQSRVVARLREDAQDEAARGDELGRAVYMSAKLENELVLRLSGLADKKIGRATFHFASQKLEVLAAEEEEFRKFVDKSRIKAKRNQQVAHREVPEAWGSLRPIWVEARAIARAVAAARILMRRFDAVHLGPAAKYLWRESRRRRHDFSFPPEFRGQLLRYYRLPAADRLQIVFEENRKGRVDWTPMDTTINGKSGKVAACKQWGVVILGDRLVALDSYPLIELKSIDTTPAP